MTRRVAIVGCSFRFPGTTSSSYWDDLLNGRDLVTTVAPDRWAANVFQHPDKNHPGTSYTFAAGSVGDVFSFDAEFFGISPREAALMDPQQRLLLELSWEALENAGIRPSTLRGSACGVFIGIASADYSYRLADDLAAIDSSAATGNTASIAANRLSYFFDLRGPSMAIDTACSSSLVAFHQACRSILSGESTQALAGGVSLHLHPYGFIIFSKASMLSRRGRCRVFDASGDGYVRSEGGGVFVLKDYEQAVADGDRVLAVVANSAINTDGRKSGITVPNPVAQRSLLTDAYAQAGIDPATIDYVEAHGTGTVVGDPIETRALGEAIGRFRPKASPLLIGSVKSNLGHMEAASGVAGLVKALFCLQHRTVPATIGLSTPNPNIRFDDWNLEVVTENRKLPKFGKLVVGINSFGFGGANAHVILESHESPIRLPSKYPKRSTLPIILSARDETGLIAVAKDLLAFLRDQPATALYDIAYHAAFRRDWLDYRAVVFGATHNAVARSLEKYISEDSGASPVETGRKLDAAQGPVFVYTGNGSQWFGMGKRLLKEPTFAQAISEIDAIFEKYADFTLREELAGKQEDGRYEYTEIAQPALFAVQVGVTRMLRTLGVNPVAVTGHSVGEVAAAWASGALSLEAAVKVIFHRSRLQGLTKGKGQMTAVSLSVQETRGLLEELGLSQSLSVAGINSSKGVTIAGNCGELARLEAVLTEREIFCKRLDLDYAFHSPAMDHIEQDIIRELSDLECNESLIPFYSTVTGQRLDGRELRAEYWWHNIRWPVLFEQSVKNIVTAGVNLLVEIGPHPALRVYLYDALKDMETTGRIIPTLSRGDDGVQRVLGAASQVMLAGADMDWECLFPAVGRFVQIPNYPWQRVPHRHNVTSESLGLLYRDKKHPLLGYPRHPHEWVWENQIDTRTHPTLADHIVGEVVVFPGSGFAEIALAAAQACSPDEYIEIEELEIRSPLLLSSEHPKILQVAVDAADGSLSIRARTYVSSEAWTLHAVSRILREPSGILLQRVLPVLPSRHPDYSREHHELMTKALGLDYGPAYKVIDHGWVVEADSAVAVYRIPNEIKEECAHYNLHPAILDSAFQLIIQILNAERLAYEGVTFVPTKIGRIALHSSRALPHFAHARLLRRAPHSLLADFTIFDQTGLPLAFIKGVRFSSVRLRKSVADQLRYLRYHTIPKPHPLAKVPAPLEFEDFNYSMKEAVRRCVLKGAHRRYSEEIEPLLDELCSRFVLEALTNADQCNPDRFSSSRFSNVAAAEAKDPFVRHLLSMLSDDGLIEATENGWRASASCQSQATAQDIWNSLVADYPDYFQIIHAVGCVGMHLKERWGVIFERGDTGSRESGLPVLTRQVLGAAGRASVGQALSDRVRKVQADLSEGKRLSIIEVCAGQPSYALEICSALDFDRGEFVFASTDETSMEQVKAIRDKFPGIQIHSVSRSDGRGAPPLESGRLFHLAIVTMDFSQASKTLKAMEYAGAHLESGGALLVLGQHPTRWIDFVSGVETAGGAATSDGRWITQQHSVRFWQRHLEQMGFEATSVLEFAPDTSSGPYLLLAQRGDAGILSVPPSTGSASELWLIIADEQGYSSALADHLERIFSERDKHAIVASVGGQAHFEQVFNQYRAPYGQFSGIVLLAGLNALPGQDGEASILEHQVDRCTALAAIIRASEATFTEADLWIVTSGAMSDMLPQRFPAGRGLAWSSFGDSALWGLGRTLMNERPDPAVYLVDLEDSAAPEVAAAALMREFDAQDGEQEIIITSRGERFVPRLELVSRPGREADQHRTGRDHDVRLEFHMPGQLRHLRWKEYAPIPPSDEEIEIEVRATGLNFRDVMYALGLLSDEAVENGFAGPTLGLEFAGVVLRAGSDTNGFAAGDRVVGFGPSSFSNRVLTRPNAISHIPPGISFEAAATIPGTFFTAYYALHHLARLSEGERVLIHGAAGGVGIAAIQIAKWCGAEIFATAGSDDKRNFLRLLGIENIFDSRSLSFADEILELTQGEGVDVVLNSLAGEAVNRNLSVLKPFGRFLELGKRDFYENTKIGLRPLRNNLSYFGIDADQLMVERPDLTRKIFGEVMALFVEGVLHPLPYHAFEADDVVDAFRYMQQSKQIGKIVVTYGNGIRAAPSISKSPAQTLEFKPEVSYLVTGGLSGFGLKVTEWLCKRGARHLIVLSRSGLAAEEDRERIAALEKDGVQIIAAPCDVTDKASLSSLLRDAAKSAPPIRGIFHAAAVFDDGLIRNMEAEQLRRVFLPKILGAQNLHDASLSMELDFFVLFSSATTLFGNPGQGNYVAANSWMEALARHRRGLGLPATSVLWGAIDDAGFLARNEQIKDALQNRMGGSAIQSAVALEALESLLLANRSGEGVLEFDWKALSRFLPSAGSPKFHDLIREVGDFETDEDHSGDVRKQLAGLSAAAAVSVLSGMLKHEVGEILRISPDKIDSARSIYDMGLDSLMGVELAAALESRFGVKISVMALSENPTIEKLAERINALLRGPADGGSGFDDGTVLSQVQRVASQHAADVSAEAMAEIAADLQTHEASSERRLIH